MAWSFVILGTSFEQNLSPCLKDAPYQISIHSDQWFTRFII